MALSASTDFSVDRNTLIKASMRLIGALDPEETPTATEINNASEALNMMLKAWMVDGLQVWIRKTKSITLTASKASYTLGPSGADVTMDRPERVLFLTRKDSSGNETRLTTMTREGYETLGNKTTTGTPTQYHYHPSITSGTLYIWPTANSTAASAYTLEMVYQKPIDDLDSSTDNFEVPPHWYEAIKYGLAHRLAPEFDTPLDKRRLLYNDFKTVYELAVSANQGESVYFQPETK